MSRHDSKASLSPLDSLLLARRVRKFIRLACARIDDRQFVLVLRMSLDPRGREAYLLAFRLMHAGLRGLEGRESVILDVLSSVRLHFAFHQIVPIHVFPRVAQFRSGRYFDIICLSSNQRVASYKDRECDRHQEWTDHCNFALPINVFTMADSKHKNVQDFLLDLVDDSELSTTPTVEPLELAAQCLSLVGILGETAFKGVQQPFLIWLRDDAEILQRALFDKDFIGQALS